ncbi:hypothetical protein PoB_000855900 [Plakobranchus ocellatus]|uniref:Uncharacterized protein n=1 Tax=Plakobranchus ocellatus TaxID=259542 RepID=A0AAV3YIF0_9GAST|nr:hypothetical protein PoB_000855900 [Plakobranchus ocellatus]
MNALVVKDNRRNSMYYFLKKWIGIGARSGALCYIKDLNPAALKSSPTEAINIEHFWNSAFEAVPNLVSCARIDIPQKSLYIS